MFTSDTVETFRKQYPNVHPLLFHRSIERAKSPGDLFDILSTIPTEMPVVWSDAERRWVHTDDILQSNSFKMD